MLITYFFLTIYILIPRYFFIPLIIGVVILLSVRGRSGVVFARTLGVLITGIGVYGAIHGLPYRYEEFKRERESRAYFENTCESKAAIELPKDPKPSERMIWLDPKAAKQSFLSGKDRPEDFEDWKAGMYQRVVYESDDHDGVGFAMKSRSAKTAEDEKHGVDGIETIITNVITGKVIARRVVYARYKDGRSKWEMPIAVCPSNALKDANCTANGCSVIPFVRAAVPPLIQNKFLDVFNIYRGIGVKQVYCDLDVVIGPGISPNDIESWYSNEGWNFRIKGTNDHIYCGRGIFPSAASHVRFVSGGQDLPPESFLISKEGSVSPVASAPFPK